METTHINHKLFVDPPPKSVPFFWNIRPIINPVGYEIEII